ncbi:MAG: acetyl-CoA carboxylase carboxyltransferase subunit alpha [Deltaproteobacteria bacterium]|nr:acetyl-CoA carboxylase carboxyltransferase subunit alpha [Deltaproteobacteria bacterium]
MTKLHSREFEKPIDDIEAEIAALKKAQDEEGADNGSEIKKLEKESAALKKKIFSSLTPWQVTLVARHPQRPYTLNHIENMTDEFIELHGDRLYKDDPAIVGGLGRIGGTAVVIIGQQKGRTTKERVRRNYGMPHPEGYRKALRLMELADRFNRPLVTLIDTPGAAPDIEAEERGQSEAIARNLLVMSKLRVPVVSAIIGEGGSGGALAIGVANKVLMFEYSTYSVISPEGCAAILWKDGSKADEAAKALKMEASELLELGIIDKIVKEPLGGAHRDQKEASENLKQALLEEIESLSKFSPDALVSGRYDKFRKMGVFK